MENKHYTIIGMQAFDIIKDALTDEELVGAMKYNILKYKLRLGNKDDIEKELKKIKHYEAILDNYEINGNWELFPTDTHTMEELEKIAGFEYINIPDIDPQLEEIVDSCKPTQEASTTDSTERSEGGFLAGGSLEELKTRKIEKMTEIEKQENIYKIKFAIKQMLGEDIFKKVDMGTIGSLLEEIRYIRSYK